MTTENDAASAPVDWGYTMLRRKDGAPCGFMYPDDIHYMRALLRTRGYDADPHDIQWAWQEYSADEWSASWINPGTGQTAEMRQWVFSSLLKYLQPNAKDHRPREAEGR